VKGQRELSGLPSSLGLVAWVVERERGEGKAVTMACITVADGTPAGARLLCKLTAAASARDRASGVSEARVRVFTGGWGFYTPRSTR
jgi:hypothetical protein